MELLDSLNAASFLVTQPAAAAAVAEEEEEEEQQQQPKPVAATNFASPSPQTTSQVRQQVQVRHHFITQPNSNDPSRPLSI